MTTSRTDRIAGVIGQPGFKTPCAAASTAALTLSGEQTVDGVAVVDGDRVLVKDQASGVDNGIYVVSTSAWARAKDMDGKHDVVRGALVHVVAGDTNSGFWYVTTSGTIVVGTTSLAFARASTELATVSAYAQTLLDDTTADEAQQTLGIADANGWVHGSTPTYVSSSSFTVVGDQTSTLTVGRRVKITDSGGTKYGTILTSAFTSLTTITLDSNSDSLASPLSAFKYGIFDFTPASSSFGILDEDTMVTNSAKAVPTQQSVKAYVDGKTWTAVTKSTTTTTVEFTIPAGTRRIRLAMDKFVGNDASNPSTTILAQMSSGSYETSGYSAISMTTGGTKIPSARTGTSAGGEASDAFAIYTLNNGGSYELTGHIEFTHVGSNVWVSTHTLVGEDAGNLTMIHGGGRKTLSGELQAIKLFEDPAGATLGNTNITCLVSD